MKKDKKTIPHDPWKNRRAMAWISMICGALFPLYLGTNDSCALQAATTAYYIFLGSIVSCYIGFVTLDDKWRKEK